MSVSVNITVDDQATPRVRRMVRDIGDGGQVAKGLLQAVGARVAYLIQGHFDKLPPNKNFPGQTTNFWKGASRATNHQVEGGAAWVNVNQIGVRQRLHGGVLRPVKAKYLTIPARAEAYGKSAQEFNNLRMVFFKGGGAALVQADATRVKIGRERKDGTRKVQNLGSIGGLVMYWLKKAVVQQANPNTIPTDEALHEAALQGVREYLDLKKS